jgi:hypothetical protein
VKYMSAIKLKRGIKANLPSLEAGEPAFTTDTYELFVGSDTGNVQVGNMLKSVYDINGNGIVDDASKLGTQLPSYYLDLANATGTMPSTKISDFTAAAQDAIGSSISNTGRTVTLSYSDVANTLSADVKFDGASIQKNGSDELYVPEGTTLVKGIVKLIDSVTNTSIITAATPNSVKTVQDALDTHTGNTTDAHGLDNFLVKDLAAGSNISITPSAGTYTIAATNVGEVNTVSNVNTAGSGLFKAKTGVNFELYGIASLDSSLTVALNGTSNVVNITHPALTLTTHTSQTGATVVKSVTLDAKGHVSDIYTGTLTVADVTNAASVASVNTVKATVRELQTAGVTNVVTGSYGTVTDNNDGTITLNGWNAYFADINDIVEFDALDVDLGSAGAKAVYLSSDGTASVSTVNNPLYDPAKIHFGFFMLDGTDIHTAIIMPDLTLVPSAFRTYLEMVEIPVSKLTMTTNTGALTLARAGGSMLVEGINYTSNGDKNSVSFVADASVDMAYFDADGLLPVPVVYGANIDPNKYFDTTDSTIKNATAGKFTVQEIRLTVEGKYFVRYGTVLFDTLSAAKDGLLTAQLAPMDSLFGLVSTPVYRLAVGQGATDLTNTASASLVRVSLTGGSAAGESGGVGGGSANLPFSDAETLLYAAGNPNAQARFVVSGSALYTYTLPGKSGTVAMTSDIVPGAYTAIGDAATNSTSNTVAFTWNGTTNKLTANVVVDDVTIEAVGATKAIAVKSITASKVSNFSATALTVISGAINNPTTNAATLSYNGTNFSVDVKVDGVTVVKNGTTGNLEVGAITASKVSNFTQSAKDAAGAALDNTDTTVTLAYAASKITANVNIDNSSIKVNGSHQLYVDFVDGGTF